MTNFFQSDLFTPPPPPLPLFILEAQGSNGYENLSTFLIRGCEHFIHFSEGTKVYESQMSVTVTDCSLLLNSAIEQNGQNVELWSTRRNGGNAISHNVIHSATVKRSLKHKAARKTCRNIKKR